MTNSSIYVDRAPNELHRILLKVNDLTENLPNLGLASAKHSRENPPECEAGFSEALLQRNLNNSYVILPVTLVTVESNVSRQDS